jgi:hypothetical protein
MTWSFLDRIDVLSNGPHPGQTRKSTQSRYRARLSGGERQRIAIARAIVKDAPIVLLDEATAALDPAKEVAVQQALTALTANRTLLVIAHRLQTVRDADQILVLDAGSVTERGSHDELLAADGRYAAFWRERERAGGSPPPTRPRHLLKGHVHDGWPLGSRPRSPKLPVVPTRRRRSGGPVWCGRAASRRSRRRPAAGARL